MSETVLSIITMVINKKKAFAYARLSYRMTAMILFDIANACGDHRLPLIF